MVYKIGFTALVAGVSMAALLSGAAFADSVSVQGVGDQGFVRLDNGKLVATNVLGGQQQDVTGLTFSSGSGGNAKTTSIKGSGIETTGSLKVGGNTKTGSLTVQDDASVGGSLEVAQTVTAKEVDAKKVSAFEVDAVKVDAVKVDAVKVEAKEVDAKKVNAFEVDAFKVDAVKVEAKEVDAKKVNAFEVDAVKVNAVKVEAKEVDAKKVKAFEVDAVKVNAKEVNAKDVNTKNLYVTESANFNGNRVEGVGAPILGTDAANKAYVDYNDAVLNNRIKDVRDGVAIALAIQTPDLIAGEKFGVSVNWGNFEGANAFGVGLQGVLGNNLLGAGERVSLTGGVGVSTERSNVGGRAGVQFTW
ncbi:hypothetical protein QMO75_11375 [Rhodomicrobium lacus]|nr:hypothetical protein [Rhodomicrobium lacus]WKW49895.1 hypothetical protein QMO75_11375 [Rhodomicrobium lacus]